ncbi:uncharacterized protein LOC119999820 [Tripterygium wilfordii]|uniref:uncharacterized protein LOC119999820 n=1 Tax=Tripterygium wilfordii TaxID=458696 RepID=UPI0018F8493E|nr:uncharacterized protein LOC119999820 [Tripterygium wilfordii]XP_038703518.1 uncharacterized protein LOC119999820 [Tripterygium wilfordii]
MSKREKNQSHYEQRKKFISWTIEWRFHSTDVVLLDRGMHEDETLASSLSVLPSLGGSFILPFFVRVKGPRSPYHELDVKAPLTFKRMTTGAMFYQLYFLKQLF